MDGKRCLGRLKRKTKYQPIGFELLPEKFTIPQLQELYEVIYQKKIDAVPKKIFVKYYAPKTEVKLYLNGKLVEVMKEGGGRKRHYTHVLLNGADQFLKSGKNILAIEAISSDDVRAFDIGLYTTQLVNPESKN